MKFPSWIKVYGDQAFRGDCPAEAVEQVTFFNRLRREYPDTWGAVALHPRNERKRYRHQALREISEGLSKGAPDIIIPGPRTFCCELKRKDHTKSRWQDGQRRWLKTAHDAGAFVCVALGWEAAMEAFNEWIAENKRREHEARHVDDKV